MKSYAILFDFDGTLVNSEPAILYSYRWLFKKYRTVEEFTPEYQVKVLGPSLDSMVELFFPDEDTTTLVNEYRRIQKENLKDLMEMMPHAIEVLSWLKQEEYPVGLVSSRRRDSIETVIRELDIEDYFDFYVGYEEVEHEKPHPEGIFKALDYFQTKEGIYIGDSKSDIEAGQNAGLPTIGYISKEEKKSAIEEAKPTYIITDLIEIKSILEQD